MPDVLEAPLVVASLDDGARKPTSSSFRLVTYPLAARRRGGLSLLKSMSGGVEIPARGALRLTTSHTTSHHPHYGLDDKATLVHHPGHQRDLMSHPSNCHFRHKSGSQTAVRCLSIKSTMRANERWVLLNKDTFQEIFDATLHEMTRTPGDYLDDKDGDVEDQPPSPVTPESHYMRHQPEGSLSAAISRVCLTRKHFPDRMQVNLGEACPPEGSSVLRQVSPAYQENQGLVAAPPLESAKTNALCDITNDHHGRVPPSSASASSTTSSSPGPGSPLMTSSSNRNVRSPQSPLVGLMSQPMPSEVPDRENEPLDLSNKRSPVCDADADSQKWPRNVPIQGRSSGEQAGEQASRKWSATISRPSDDKDLLGSPQSCSSDSFPSNNTPFSSSISSAASSVTSSPTRQLTSSGEGVKVSLSANKPVNEREKAACKGGQEENDEEEEEEKGEDHQDRSQTNFSTTIDTTTTTELQATANEGATAPAPPAAAASEPSGNDGGSDELAPDDPRALSGVVGGREGCGGARANNSPPPPPPPSSCSTTMLGSATTTTTTTTPASTTTNTTTPTNGSSSGGSCKHTTTTTDSFSQRASGKVTSGSEVGGVGGVRSCGNSKTTSCCNSGREQPISSSQYDRTCSSSGIAISNDKQLDKHKVDKTAVDVTKDTTSSVDNITETKGVVSASNPGGETGGLGGAATGGDNTPARCVSSGQSEANKPSTTGEVVVSSGKVSPDDNNTTRMTTTAAPNTTTVHHHHHHHHLPHHRRISIGGVGGGGVVQKQGSENWAPLSKTTVYDLVEEVMISLGESQPDDDNKRKPHSKEDNNKACTKENRSDVVNQKTDISNTSSLNNNYVNKNCVALTSTTPKSTTHCSSTSSVLNPVIHVQGRSASTPGKDGVEGKSPNSEAISLVTTSAASQMKGSRTKCQLRDHLSARSQCKASPSRYGSSSDALLASDGGKPHQGAKRKHEEVLSGGAKSAESIVVGVGNRLESNRGVTSSGKAQQGTCPSQGGALSSQQQGHNPSRRSPLCNADATSTATSAASPTSKVKQQCWVALNKMVVFDIVDSAMRNSEDEEEKSPQSSCEGDSNTTTTTSSSDDNKGQKSTNIRCTGYKYNEIGVKENLVSKGKGDDGDSLKVSLEASDKGRVSPGSPGSSSKSGDNNINLKNRGGKSDLISEDKAKHCHDDSNNSNNNNQFKNKVSFSAVKKRQCDVLEEAVRGELCKRRRSDSVPTNLTTGPRSPLPIRSPPRESSNNSLEGLLSDSCKDLRRRPCVGGVGGRESRLVINCSEGGRPTTVGSDGAVSQAGKSASGITGCKQLGPSQGRGIDRGSPSEKFTPVNQEHEKAVHALAPSPIRSPCSMSENNQFAPSDMTGQRGAGTKVRSAVVRAEGESIKGNTMASASSQQESQVESRNMRQGGGGVVTVTGGSSTRDARSSPRLGWVAVSKIDVHNIVDSVVDSMIAGEICGTTSQPRHHHHHHHPHHDVTASTGDVRVYPRSPVPSGSSSSPLPTSSSSSSTSSPLPPRKVISPVGSPIPAREAEGCPAASPPHHHHLPSSSLVGVRSPRTESSSDRATPSPVPASPCSPASPAETSERSSSDSRMTKAFKWKSSLLMRVEEEKIDVTPDVVTSTDLTSAHRTNAGSGKAKESKSESRTLRSGRRSSRKGNSSSVGKLK